jgi:hypothetical protein
MCSLLKENAREVACVFWEMLVIIGHGRIANTPSSKDLLSFRYLPHRARVGLPISVLVTAQNFGFVMGYTPNAQLRNYNPHHANHCLRRDWLDTFRIECVTHRDSIPKSPHDY